MIRALGASFVLMFGVPDPLLKLLWFWVIRVCCCNELLNEAWSPERPSHHASLDSSAPPRPPPPHSPEKGEVLPVSQRSSMPVVTKPPLNPSSTGLRGLRSSRTLQLPRRAMHLQLNREGCARARDPRTSPCAFPHRASILW